MKQIFQKHKTKLIIASPVLVIILLTVLAIYILSLSAPTLSVNLNTKETSALQAYNNLNVEAKSFIVYNSNSKKIIYSKKETAQLPLASLAKIMSTLAALDLAPRDAVIEAVGSDGLNHLWRLDDLLRLTLVASSNSDISSIVKSLTNSNSFPRTKFGFVGLMNDKAKVLGLKQTFFLNESGLDLNGDLSGAYGSAHDVARLFDFALRSASDIFGTTKFNSITVRAADGVLESVANTNQTVSKIQGIVASKTGLTDLAGGNLAVAFDIDQNTRIIIVVLGSTQAGRFADVETLSKATLSYYSNI